MVYKDSKIEICFVINDICNLKCEYCDFYNTVNYDVTKIWDKINELTAYRDDILIDVTGGEPTLNNKLFYILSTKQNQNIEISTNLTNNVDVYNKIVDYGALLHVSLHYNELKRKNIVDNFIKNIEIFSKYIKPLTIMFEKNIDNDFITILKYIKDKIQIIDYICDIQKVETYYNEKDKLLIKYIINNILHNNINDNKFFCTNNIKNCDIHSRDRLTIDFKGNIHFCTTQTMFRKIFDPKYLNIFDFDSIESIFDTKGEYACPFTNSLKDLNGSNTKN